MEKTALPYSRAENPKKPNENNLLLYQDIAQSEQWILLVVIGSLFSFWETALPYSRAENPKKPNENNLLLYQDIAQSEQWMYLVKTALSLRLSGCVTNENNLYYCLHLYSFVKTNF